MSLPRALLNCGGFTLWKIDPKDAAHHPTGAEYAGMARTPDGQLWGIHACVRELAGRKHFEGGLYPVDPYAEAPPPTAQLLTACAESAPVHSPTPSPGTPTVPPPQGDLVAMAEAITRDVAEFDDSKVLEELPL